MEVHLIAIVGGSGSGKTWLAQRLLEEFGNDAARLSLDDFYRDLSHLPTDEHDRTNFDHPNAIDWPLFRRSISSIRRGEATELPMYDFPTHTRRAEAKTWKPRRLVLLDGLWLLRRAELRQLYSRSVFVECVEHLRLERRMERDQRERGRSARSVRAQFEKHVAPMHNRFVARQMRHADLVVQSPTSPRRVTELHAHFTQLLLP